jgi:hypothetical protein
MYATTSHGANILHLAIHGTSEHHLECVSLISHWDAELSLLKRCVNNRGLIPSAVIGSNENFARRIHSCLETTWECARDCNVSGLRKLLERGKPLDAKGQVFGITPLHMAILGHHAPRILLELSQCKVRDKEPMINSSSDNSSSIGDNNDMKFRIISNAKRVLLRIEKKQDKSSPSSSSFSSSSSSLSRRSSKKSLLYGTRDTSSETNNVALKSTLTFLLTTCKAYVDPCDFYGRTPLMLAPIANASESTATMLIRAGADLETKDVYGNTPLHYAYAFCKSRSSGAPTTLISLLLAAGASPCVTNLEGQTPKAVMGLRHKICVKNSHSPEFGTRRSIRDDHSTQEPKENTRDYSSTMFT